LDFAVGRFGHQKLMGLFGIYAPLAIIAIFICMCVS